MMYKLCVYCFCIFLFSGTLFGAVQKSEYALSEGKAAHARLKEQHALIKDNFFQIMKKVSALRQLEGLSVVDYGCGTGETTAEFIKLVGPEGHYVGIDQSLAQIDFAKNRYPKVMFMVGNEASKKVQKTLGKADLVYMRFVLMHQKNPEHFLKTIYSAMKPGGILVMQEANRPESISQEMIQRYKMVEGIETLSTIKKITGERMGINYNAPARLKEMAMALYPAYLDEQVDAFEFPIAVAVPNLHKAVTELLSKGALTIEEAKICRNALSQLPAAEGNTWHAGEIRSVIIQK